MTSAAQNPKAVKGLDSVSNASASKGSKKEKLLNLTVALQSQNILELFNKPS